MTTTCLIGVAVGSASCGEAANAGSAPFAASTIDKQRAELALLTLRGMGFSCLARDETLLPERQGDLCQAAAL